MKGLKELREISTINCAPVQSQIQPHELRELWVFVAQLADEVRRPVLVGIDCSYARSISEEIAVDDSGDGWQLCYQVH